MFEWYSGGNGFSGGESVSVWRRRTGALLPALLALITAAVPAAALGPGDPAPAFVLPWLTDEGTAASADLFGEHDATVLMIWDRGCPHCTEVALSSEEFADAVARLGARLVGVVMGPDDRGALEDLFWEEGLLVPHLWDEGRKLAGRYGLGFQHLGIFVIDRSGTIRAVFDDRVDDPVEEVLPAVRAVVSQPLPASQRPAPILAVEGPNLRIDGRLRILSTEGARPGDTGLYGELLENGSVFLHRWDLRAVWSLAPGVEFIPWLRLSNESETVLTEAEDRLANRYGSATLRFTRGPVSASLGAFDLMVSPLLLMRWDEEDAPPLAGASGCGVCGAGASGLEQRSLEILEPEYTFEGLAASFRRRYSRIAGWVAVSQWERQPPAEGTFDELASGRYRRILSGGLLDLGPTSQADPRLGLPTGIGLRFGVVAVQDDQRSIEKHYPDLSPHDRDEVGWVVLSRLGPWSGVSVEGEWVDWSREIQDREEEADAVRIGLTAEREMGRIGLWGRFHRIRTDRLFEPRFRALTYDGNREGWRAAAGMTVRPVLGGRERFGVSLFYRGVEETDPVEAPAHGAVRYRIASATLSGRPAPDLLVEMTGLLLENDSPVAGLEDEQTRGIAGDLRWERIPVLEPVLHVEMIRSEPRGADAATIWQVYLSARILK
ncbi:MAG: redoxin domain-containing protein [Candidatus Eisenbacteria bacterium]|nr:redoxin domain-containing protein [Candidatus Latescibacterota bacterium]MBD3301794.1 redoxin domain-containing protein [Candidatus Eisenbacteria bacterium]